MENLAIFEPQEFYKKWSEILVWTQEVDIFNQV